MAGGIPKYLSCSLIIEEGFLLDDLKLILNSMKETAKACDIQIVTGDTKVIENRYSRKHNMEENPFIKGECNV